MHGYTALHTPGPAGTDRLNTAGNSPLPNISEVDFDRADDISGFASLLTVCASNAGMFMAHPSRQGKEQSAIAATARQWINALIPRLHGMHSGDTLTVLSSFDIIHRIGFNTPADPGITAGHTLSAFNAYIRGDRSIDIYTLFRAISQEILKRDRTFLDKPLRWNGICIESWYKNFSTTANGLTDYDTLQQINILLDENLFAFEAGNQQQFKQRLINANRHYLYETSLLDSRSLPLLKPLLIHAMRLGIETDFQTCSREIDNAIISCPRINRYHRAALELSRLS